MIHYVEEESFGKRPLTGVVMSCRKKYNCSGEIKIHGVKESVEAIKWTLVEALRGTVSLDIGSILGSRELNQSFL